MFTLFEKKDDHLPEIGLDRLSDDQVLENIASLKSKLKDQVVILGHHYQQNDIIQFADLTGDSLQLAKDAAKLSQPFILFCGVHFMAETADMLTKPHQQVILPDLNAGCSMADMAKTKDVEKAWARITDLCPQSPLIPITYVNCSASLKAFVGKNGGTICTSSNAKKIISWAFNQGEKLLFFPDQHLGRNTCFELGIKLDEMAVYNPNLYQGGLSDEQIKNAKVILWYGYCSVHKGFEVSHIENIRKNKPQTKVIVHPECEFDVVQKADDNGSTAYIIDVIKKSPPGTSWAVGTEINLVSRLAAMVKDEGKEVFSLSPYQCLCTTMYRIRPRWLLASLMAIDSGQPINIVKVDEETTRLSLLALDRMLSIS